MKILIKILLLTYVFILALFSCRKDQLEIKKTADPCDCASEVSADFTMEEAALWGSTSEWTSETDSILRGRHVRFKAKQKDAEYKWYLGTETETTNETFRLFGDPSLTGTSQPIILVVKKEPNLICFPNDDGYDSVVKQIVITEYPINDWANNDSNLGTKEGVFKVKDQNSSDSIEITIDYIIETSSGPFFINIYNFDGDGTNCTESINEFNVTYRETRFRHTSVANCNRLRGYMKTPVNGKVEMYFTQQDPGDPDYREFHYFGRRIGS